MNAEMERVEVVDTIPQSIPHERQEALQCTSLVASFNRDNTAFLDRKSDRRIKVRGDAYVPGPPAQHSVKDKETGGLRYSDGRMDPFRPRPVVTHFLATYRVAGEPWMIGAEGRQNHSLQMSPIVVRELPLQSFLDLLRPGVKAKEVYRAIVSTIEGTGHKMGLHPGHSQGLDIFERPILETKEEAQLAPGMIIVVHPHVLLPSGGGVWIGDTFLVTDGGPVPLQQSAKALGVIG